MNTLEMDSKHFGFSISFFLLELESVNDSLGRTFKTHLPIL